MKEILEIRDHVETHWVGDGFPVRTYFSYQKDNELCSPFLLLDYAGPHEFTPTDKRRGVGEHPHRGFETVSIIYQGELEHRDSGGKNEGILRAGDVQWMTAGCGVVHEEFHSQDFSAKGGTLEMVQLWINLPASKKMSSPRYQEISSKHIPEVGIDSGSIRVIAGEFEGIKGPAETFTRLHLWDLSLSKGSLELSLRDGNSSILLILRGRALLNGKEILNPGELAILDHKKAGVILEVEESLKALVLSGEPIEEPVVGYGPFVMSTEQEIFKAV
ncbi:pirin family protein, partial [bacterium]|nr:pirin family protein [bacterium]